MAEIKTYPWMNEKITELLRMSEEPRQLYAAQLIEELMAGAQQIVRCGECRHFEPIPDEQQGFCFAFTYRQMPVDGFCCFGERRPET